MKYYSCKTVDTLFTVPTLEIFIRKFHTSLRSSLKKFRMFSKNGTNNITVKIIHPKLGINFKSPRVAIAVASITTDLLPEIGVF